MEEEYGFTDEKETGEDVDHAKPPLSAEVTGYGAWISVETRMPDYYETVWASDGIGVALGRLVGRSYEPPLKIWRNVERTGCDELCGIKFWQPCFKPTAP